MNVKGWSALIRRCPRLSDLVRLQLPDVIPHEPTAAQTAFLLLRNREVLFGGAAGGGKSEALLMAALQFVHVPNYRALLLRRTHTDLALPGALLDRARLWLQGSGARWNQTDKAWTFPSGAVLSFGYLDHPNQKCRYQSSEFQFIGFDELTQFGESEYTYLFSRLRRLRGADVPLRMRSASNPGGLGHDWVRRRFLREGRSSGRIFIPARLKDNPHLDHASYIESLSQLDPLTRSHLLDGDWDADDDRLLAYDAIQSCVADTLWKEGPSGGRTPGRELYVGIDIGRTQDRTVIWTWEKVGDVCWCRDLCVLSGARFSEQKDAIRARLVNGVTACAIDKGGIGCQLAEELEREYPGIVQGVRLTAGVQGRLARRLAIGFAERRVRIPDDRELRDDLRQVRKTRTVGGIDRVASDRTSTGHADRFWAAALGYDAASISDDLRIRASLPRALSRTSRP